MRRIVFDIETKSASVNDLSKMEISLLGVYDSETDAYSAYLEEDFPKLWPVLENADVLIGYNSDHFDIPILNRYYPGDLTQIRSLDLLKEIKKASGRRFKLDSIAEATLGQKKSGHGLQAVQWWNEGKIDQLREYCIQDVRVTKELYDFALRHGKLKYKDLGGLQEIVLDTSTWEASEDDGEGMTHTLPF